MLAWWKSWLGFFHYQRQKSFCHFNFLIYIWILYFLTSVQPTFIHGAKRATSALGSIVPNDGSFQQTSELELMDLDDSIEQSVSSLSVVGPSALKQRPTDASVPKSKEYREPWVWIPRQNFTLSWLIMVDADVIL